ncbi:MAG: flippase, partial [Dehalococcoidia bacterium]|nr:flippase [Dehalococcoidia bacterium]
MSNGVRRFAGDVGFSLTSLGVSALIYFVLRIFLGRYLGPGDLGLYTLAFTVYSYGWLVSTFGINAALTKYVAEFKEDVPRTNLLITSGSIIATLIGCIVGLIVYVSSTSIASLFDMPELGGLLRIVAISFPFIALEIVVLGFLNGLRRMRLFAFINITQSVLTIIITVALVLWGYGLSGAVFAFVLSVILMSLFSLFSIRSSLIGAKLKQYAPAIKMLLVFGGYVVLASAIGMVQTSADSIMIGYFMTETDVGYYAVAVVLSHAMWMIPRAVSMITTPTMSTYHGRGKIDSIEDLVNKIMKYTAAFLIPVGFVIAFLSRPIITLIFGKAFAPATLPLQLLLVGAVCYGVIASVGTALSSTGHVDMLFKLTSIAATAPESKVNNTFNVGATKFETMKADLQALLDYAGFGRHVIRIPSWLVIPLLKILEYLHVSPLYEWVYET